MSTLPRIFISHSSEDVQLTTDVKTELSSGGEFELLLDTDRHQESLFNLVQDPGETQNLIGRHSQKASELRAALSRRADVVGERLAPTRSPEQLSDSEVQALRSLGYLGSQ